MTESNVKIINDLKEFLEETVKETTQREKYSYSAKDFTRKRMLTFSLLTMMILNSLKRSLSVELQDFFGHFSKGGTCSKQAFSAQRTKLNALFFHDWNQVLVESFYRHYGQESKTWKGMRLWGMDGSTIALPDREELKEQYGCSSNQTGDTIPVARICVLYDVLNHIAIKGFLHSYFVSEQESSLPCLENLNLEHTLLLFDRGYPSYWLIHQLLQRKSNFVMRVQRNWNDTVKSFLNSDRTDATLDIYPSYISLKKLRNMNIEISKQAPLKVRMVKVLLNTGETEVLITSLYDAEIYTIEELKEVYHLRWGIETFYGYAKEELQLAQFSGIRAICIEQDFAANLLLFNLQSLVEKQTKTYVDAVSRKRKYRYKVNKNISWASLKYRVVKLFLTKNCRSVLIELQNLFEKYLEPIRPNRKYPRIEKRKPRTKHYFLTNYKRAL